MNYNSRVHVTDGPFINDEHKQTVVGYYSGHINNTKYDKLRLILNFDKPDASIEDIVHDKVRTMMVTIPYETNNVRNNIEYYSNTEGLPAVIKRCEDRNVYLDDKIAVSGLISPTLTGVQYMHKDFVKKVAFVDDDMQIKFPTPTDRVDNRLHTNVLNRYKQHDDWKNAAGEDVQTITGHIAFVHDCGDSYMVHLQFFNNSDERSEMIDNDGITDANIYFGKDQLGAYKLGEALRKTFGENWWRRSFFPTYEAWKEAGLKMTFKGLAYKGIDPISEIECFKMIPYAGLLIEKNSNEEIKAPVMPRKIWRSYEVPF